MDFMSNSSGAKQFRIAFCVEDQLIVVCEAERDHFSTHNSCLEVWKESVWKFPHEKFQWEWECYDMVLLCDPIQKVISTKFIVVKYPTSISFVFYTQ